MTIFGRAARARRGARPPAADRPGPDGRRRPRRRARHPADRSRRTARPPRGKRRASGRRVRIAAASAPLARSCRQHGPAASNFAARASRAARSPRSAASRRRSRSTRAASPFAFTMSYTIRPCRRRFASRPTSSPGRPAPGHRGARRGRRARRRGQVLLGITGSRQDLHGRERDRRRSSGRRWSSRTTRPWRAQLYGEFKELFPDNAVQYFVSYYDYYQPEAYVPSTDTYIEKDSIDQRGDRSHAPRGDALRCSRGAT